MRAHVGAATARAVPQRPAPRLAEGADAGAFDGAARGLTVPQAMAAAVILSAVVAGLSLAPHATLGVLHDIGFVGFAAASVMRLAAALLQRTPDDIAALPDHRLPLYTVIAPLYREASVAAELVAALEAIDYPPHRLQALLVLEADDAETLEALEALPLPAFMQVLIAPPGTPRTKPRACNVALERARGELVVIYDAEDRPHPQQLREAAARFAAAPASLACLQAPLRIDADPRFLPAQFALEYAVQFEVIQPAFTAIGAPFPLGGTSNHFRADALRAVGGWDAFNVTEDADVGFRLCAAGYRLGVMEAPTFEAAPETWADWLPQRTRWVKGYMQTFGVQTRQLKGSFVALLATLGVSIASAFLHGPLAAWIAAGLLFGALSGQVPQVEARDVGLLGLGWASAAAAGLVGLRRAGLPVRARDLLLAPVYWLLQSLAAAHALYQLARMPYHWDKTRHTPRAGRADA